MGDSFRGAGCAPAEVHAPGLLFVFFPMPEMHVAHATASGSGAESVPRAWWWSRTMPHRPSGSMSRYCSRRILVSLSQTCASRVQAFARSLLIWYLALLVATTTVAFTNFPCRRRGYQGPSTTRCLEHLSSADRLQPSTCPPWRYSCGSPWRARRRASRRRPGQVRLCQERGHD